MSIEKTIPLMFKARVLSNPDIIAQAAKNEKGAFEYFTYKRLYDDVILFASSLKKLGIKRDDHIAFISDNRREWLISDLAILSLGAVDVPRGKDSMAAEVQFIINYADCFWGIFENTAQLEKVLEPGSEKTKLKNAILFDEPKKETLVKAEQAGIKTYYFKELMEEIGTDPQPYVSDIEAEMEKTQTEDLATIIFTSGTTGTPKGVMLTHENYMAQLEVVGQVLPAKPGDMWLSVLPVWHSFERVVQYIVLTLSTGIAYSKPVAPILLADMAEIKPQWICGVPRLWDGLGNGIIRTMKKAGGIKYAMFSFFVAVGKAYSHSKDLVRGQICHFRKKSRLLECLQGILPYILLSPLYALGNILVFAKIKEKFGGKLSAVISGGGSLQKHVEDFYHAVGVNLIEGYGITEAAPVLAFRGLVKPKSGCVGEVYPSVDVKIVATDHGTILSDEPLPPGKTGLVLARGKTKRQIMKGYYKRQDLTDQVIDKDGWLNTCDIGMLTIDNEIKITGRAKDTLVLLGGENIEPLVIEQAVNASDYIECTMLLGQDKKYLGALIVPAKDFVIAFANENNITYTSYEELLETPEIQTLIRSEIDRLVSAKTGFRSCEHIFKFVLLPESFKPGRELSAKQEMIRYKICELYKEQIEKLFAVE